MKIEKTLQNFGLSEKESKVYIALLQVGPAPVQKIADKSSLARSTIYEILGALIRRGLVNTYLKKRVKYFNPEEPDKLVKQAQSQAEAIKNALPELEAITGLSRRKPTVRFYQGKEQMKLILEEILEEAQEIHSFAVAEDLLTVLSDHHKWFLSQRLKKKIPIKLILKDSITARERQELGAQQLRQVKIVPDKYNFHGLTYIWKNKTAMFSLSNDFTAIVVDSQELTNIQRAQFLYLWDSL
jgi:HTH-type transcriptional regulator, sugar sensing transcriptional regulator